STLEAETSLTAAAQPPPIGLSLALQELFTEIKELLGKVLGPMAGFVFDEVAEEWMEQGVPEFSRIEELIKLINREIDDQDKIDNYRQLISSKLKDFQKG
ncbi:MAG: hypothetical protein U9R69_04280, partial [Thermodesulfobacteriota bacterium]|nr:hypothetical protein [Thermodesulfobacteriota bacterium]